MRHNSKFILVKGKVNWASCHKSKHSRRGKWWM